MRTRSTAIAIAAALVALTAPALTAPVMAQDDGMSFFITSAGPGNGADLGGPAGADAHCAALAEAVGAGDRNWKAYLSSSTENARDRIGAGPWVNAEGVTVAANVDELHGENNLTKQTSISEAGAVINGGGDEPNRHDILTGSNLDGTFSGSSCEDWTNSGDGAATVGHHDRDGGGANPTSWNSAHDSRGCSQSDLQGTGGDGLFYCFAAD
jgi:hypothetical protein